MFENRGRFRSGVLEFVEGMLRGMIMDISKLTIFKVGVTFVMLSTKYHDMRMLIDMTSPLISATQKRRSGTTSEQMKNPDPDNPIQRLKFVQDKMLSNPAQNKAQMMMFLLPSSFLCFVDHMSYLCYKMNQYDVI